MNEGMKTEIKIGINPCIMCEKAATCLVRLDILEKLDTTMPERGVEIKSIKIDMDCEIFEKNKPW